MDTSKEKNPEENEYIEGEKATKKVKTMHESTNMISEEIQNALVDSIITDKDFGIISKVLQIKQNPDLSTDVAKEIPLFKRFWIYCWPAFVVSGANQINEASS